MIEILIFANHIQLSDEHDCCFIYLSLYKISTFRDNLFILMQMKVNLAIYILKLILQLLLTN